MKTAFGLFFLCKKGIDIDTCQRIKVQTYRQEQANFEFFEHFWKGEKSHDTYI